MQQLLIQMAYLVPLHNMHVFDVTLHLHLHYSVPDTSLTSVIIPQKHQFCCFMSCNPNVYEWEQGLLIQGYGR